VGLGLFGKLPARRDFVEHAVDRAVMEKWDPWLQRAVQASREALGPDWLGIYLQAPIWRFWLGPAICGRTVLGALMPSVDGVGRYFPLSLVWTGERSVPPPQFGGQEDWFESAEGILLGALVEDARYEDILAEIGAMPEPGDRADAGGDPSLAGMFNELCRDSAAEIYGQYSFWWVPGDGAEPPRAMVHRGLPDLASYAGMIGGTAQEARPLAVGEA